MKRPLLVLITVFCSGLAAQGQSVLAAPQEYGIFLGGSNYVGDIGYEIVPRETHFSAGILYKYRFSPYLSWRTGLNYGQISGNDSNFSQYHDRNLNFKSNIWELTTQLEFDLFKFSGIRARRFTPYVFTGLSLFYFNPKGTTYSGDWIELQPLGTEGQTLGGHDKKYNRVQVAVPLGMGVKYKLTRNWTLGFEVGYRKTFTDYLDDVSDLYPDQAQMINEASMQAALMSDKSTEIYGSPKSQAGNSRGNPNKKDWYILAGFTLTYNLVYDNCPH